MSEVLVERWVQFSLGLIADDPANFPRLRDALTILAKEADALYPALQSGEEVRIEVAAIDVVMGPLSYEVKQQYRDLTGDILFNGVDAPKQTAEVLHTTLKGLFEHVLSGAEDDTAWQTTV